MILLLMLYLLAGYVTYRLKWNEFGPPNSLFEVAGAFCLWPLFAFVDLCVDMEESFRR